VEVYLVSGLFPTPVGLICIAGNDSRVVVWSLSSGEMLQEICVPSAGFISCVAWIKLTDRDEDTFVFSASDGNIHLYQRTSENPVFCFLSITLAHVDAIESLSWDPQHLRLASVGNGEVCVWKFSPDKSKYKPYLFFSCSDLDRHLYRILCARPQQCRETTIRRSLGSFLG
jgi:WD40 repeat protein